MSNNPQQEKARLPVILLESAEFRNEAVQNLTHMSTSLQRQLPVHPDTPQETGAKPSPAAPRHRTAQTPTDRLSKGGGGAAARAVLSARILSQCSSLGQH